jgi:hypothetical protein
MRKIAVIAARADSFCARLNDGLAAMAIVLAILTGALSTVRNMEAGGAFDAEWPMVEMKD